MKKQILFTIASFICIVIFISNTARGNDSEKDLITIQCSPELNSLSTIFAREYQMEHPQQSIRVEEFQGISQSGTQSFALVSEADINPATSPALWQIPVGRNVIVPFFSASNPFLEEINKTGISPSGLLDLIKTGEGDWDVLLSNGNNNPIKLYATTEAAASFASESFSEMKSVEKIIQAIQESPYAIGFCRMAEMPLDAGQGIPENVRLLPFDINENGKIDYFENIYSDLQSFTRGVWIGKYPKQLINNVYLASATTPENKDLKDFAGWVLTQGQKYLEQEGYSELALSERQSKLEKLNPTEITIEPERENWAVQKIILFIFMILLATGAITSLVSFYSRRKGTASGHDRIQQPGVIHEESIPLPEGLYFDKTHTWVYLEKNGTVKIGIADFLPLITGPITKVVMKAPGEKVKKNESVVTIAHEGKQINLFAPVSGTIKEINEELVTDPSLINRSPYSNGWIYQVEPSNWMREIQFFKMARDYREWLKNEIKRLKDFLAETINAVQPEFSPVYQEGGELKSHVLQNLPPNIWEEFQKKFIDTSKL